MVRVLHSVSNMDRAGIETMLMNYYRHIDREKVQFDFLCNKRKPGAYDEEIQKMGGKIFHTPGLNPVKYLKYLKCMKELFETHKEYEIIEAHNGALGVYALHAARKNRIPVRIFHAHGASITKDWKLPLKLFCKSKLEKNLTHRFTCGIAAAECYFGHKVVEKQKYEFVPNAIEVERFVFNRDIREKLREEYSLQNKFVIGHVGRFMAQKNHMFLLKVFSEYLKYNAEAVLVLLGDGELLEAVKEKVKELNIVENVIFVGNVPNANEWYQAFDLFVLPSVWEGLPVVGVEAQAADLPCIFSDNITREIGFSEKAAFVSTEVSMQVWVETIEKMKTYSERYDATELITKNHYNIYEEAKILQNRYLELYGA